MRIKGAKAVHYDSGPNMTPLVDVVMVIPRAVAQTERDRGRWTQRVRAARIREAIHVFGTEVLTCPQFLTQPALPPFV